MLWFRQVAPADRAYRLFCDENRDQSQREAVGQPLPRVSPWEEGFELWPPSPGFLGFSAYPESENQATLSASVLPLGQGDDYIRFFWTSHHGLAPDWPQTAELEFWVRRLDLQAGDLTQVWAIRR